MVEVEFNYQQNKIIIQGNLSDLFETVSKKYADKANLDINNIYFISSGKVIIIIILKFLSSNYNSLVIDFQYFFLYFKF